jgi:hypothetical protein
MQLTPCNNKAGSLSKLVVRAAAKADLQRIVNASSKDSLYEDVFPAIFMTVRASSDVLEDDDVRETLSKLSAKGIRIEDPEFQAQIMRLAFGEGLRNFWGGAKNVVQKGLQQGVGAIGNAAGAVGNAVQQGAGAVGNAVQQGAGAVGNAVGNAASAIGKTYQEGSQAVQEKAKAVQLQAAKTQATKAIQNLLQLDDSTRKLVTPFLEELQKAAAQPLQPLPATNS